MCAWERLGFALWPCKAKSDSGHYISAADASLQHLFVWCWLNVTVYETLCSFCLLLKISSGFFLAPLACASVGVCSLFINLQIVILRFIYLFIFASGKESRTNEEAKITERREKMEKGKEREHTQMKIINNDTKTGSAPLTRNLYQSSTHSSLTFWPVWHCLTVRMSEKTE